MQVYARMRNRLTKSSYAQLQARRSYYARNRAVVKLVNKMHRAGVYMSTDEARRIVQSTTGETA